ncbi:MAG: hypothetical protein ACYTDY_16165 [Planctomycetota bacterium]|jgi:hypothetical protein
MALTTRLKKDTLKKRTARNNALIKVLQGGWSDLDIVKIDRVAKGWKATYHDPPRQGT